MVLILRTFVQQQQKDAELAPGRQDYAGLDSIARSSPAARCARGQPVPAHLWLPGRPRGCRAHDRGQAPGQPSWESPFWRSSPFIAGASSTSAFSSYREGVYPVIYTTSDWWSTCTGNNSSFSACDPLWIANYSASNGGPLPNGWGYYTFWQYADSGSQPGDQDVFNGAYSQLQILADNG